MQAQMLISRSNYVNNNPFDKSTPATIATIKELDDLLGPYPNGNSGDAETNPQISQLLLKRGRIYISASSYAGLLSIGTYIFDQALKQHPDYPHNYFLMLRYAPWLYTKTELSELAKLAERAVTATSATDGKSMIARIYHTYTRLHGINPSLFAQGNANWLTVKAGFDDLIARYPSEQNKNIYAEMACIAQDKTSTHDLLGQLGGAFNAAYWMDANYMQNCSNMAK
jgi:hypothetical protein